MKNDKLMPGLILVLIGTVFLLDNFGYIDFRWGNLFRLWPVFLVIGGVNLVFAHNKSPWATIIKISVVVAGFALLVFGNFGKGYNWWPRYYYHHHNNNNNDRDDDDDDNDDNSTNKGDIVKVEGNSTFNQAYVATRVARLNISGGGTTYFLNDTTNQLFRADTKEFFGKYQFDHHLEDSVFVMDFDMKNHKGNFNFGNKNSNSADIKLNVNPEWEINIEAGAADLEFDLSKFKIRSLKLAGGAAAFKVKLGEPLTATKLNVSTGMADVNISIPQDAACRIEADSGLSSTSFDGFIKKEDGHYETAGFEAAKNKIYINMSGGISNFKVRRY